MTRPLRGYTASAFQQGPAGATSAELYDQLSDSRDFFKKVGVQQDDESKRIATNAALAEAGQLGWDMDQIQKKAPDLYAKWANDPMIDMKTMTDSMRLRGTTADQLLSGISGRETDQQQQNTSKIQGDVAAFNLETLEKEAEDRALLDGKVNNFREYVYGGGWDTEAEEKWNKHLQTLPEDMTPEEIAFEKPQFMQSYKGSTLEGADAVPKLAARFGMSVPEFMAETELGRQFRVTGDALAVERAGILAQQEADNLAKRKARTSWMESGDPGNIVYDGENFTWGANGVRINEQGAAEYADSIGLDLDDDKTQEVIATARNLFPNTNAFKAALRMAKGKKGKLKDNAQTLLREASANLLEKAGKELAEESKSEYSGLSPEDASRMRITRLRNRNAKAQEEAQVDTTIPVLENKLFNINSDTEVAAAIKQEFGVEPPIKNHQEQADYYNNSADIIEEELKSFPPTVIGRSSAQRSIPKYLKILRTGYGTAARLGSPASFAERKKTQEKALKALRELRGIAKFQSELGKSSTGDDVDERAFLRQLNK